MLNVTDIFHSFQLAMLSYIITCVLTQEGYILEWYQDLLDKLHDKSRLLAYPLGYCEKCFGGQVALWWFVYQHGNEYKHVLIDAFIRHSIFISFTIAFIIIIKHFFRTWKKT